MHPRAKREDYAIRLLSYFGLVGLFDIIHGSDFQNKLKKSDVIQLCLKESNAKNDASCMIGDTVFDFNGAKKVKIDFIGLSFGYGFRSKMDLQIIGSSKICNSYSELLDYIVNLER